MKLTKTEKIWLILVVAFYICYNLPFVPAYNHPQATLIHGALTLIPLWTAIYFGLSRVCRIYRLKDNDAPIEQNLMEQEKEDTPC